MSRGRAVATMTFGQNSTVQKTEKTKQTECTNVCSVFLLLRLSKQRFYAACGKKAVEAECGKP